jgi:predicted transcriptional regulator
MGSSNRVLSLLTVRLTVDVERRLAREARRLRKSRSEVARAILEAALVGPVVDPHAEARRQWSLASAQDADRNVLDFIQHAGNSREWR